MLEEQTKALRAELTGIDLYTLSDEELAQKTKDIRTRAIESGAWDPTRGKGADERIAFAIERYKSYGYTEEEATTKAVKDLQKNGYLEAMRIKRQDQDELFKSPISEYVEKHQLDKELEKQEIDSLLERTIDITTLTPEDLIKLSRDFPSGNFIYHGTVTKQLIEIINSGALLSAKVLYERENQAAKTESRETNIIHRNSGYEGISWSMNEIDALPGDRYHIAGFIGAPETVLNSNQQLAIPSRPAPNEVMQISSAIEANQFYDAKTQFELYRNPGMFGESNSAFDNLISISLWEDVESRRFMNEPILYRAKRGILAEADYKNQLRGLYDIQPDNKIRLNPDLLQQTNNKIPVMAVWLQAAIDTDRFKGTGLDDKEVPEIIDMLNSKNTKALFAETKKDWQQFSDILDKADDITSNIEVLVEDMYFVAPRKDAETWLKVIARSKHKPAGILLYDDKKVRLENFASLHRGDHTELTKELQLAINPDNKDYINYADILGSKFSDDKRAGNRHQVIAERHLSNRNTVHKYNGKLIIKK
jgi:hypothetical protein